MYINIGKEVMGGAGRCSSRPQPINSRRTWGRHVSLIVAPGSPRGTPLRPAWPLCLLCLQSQQFSENLHKLPGGPGMAHYLLRDVKRPEQLKHGPPVIDVAFQFTVEATQSQAIFAP